MKNITQGLNYISLELSTAKLFIFMDGSFANNKDLSSQIEYEIILTNESISNEESAFTITGNMIHWSSTKSKRVIKNILVSEVYRIVAGIDIAFTISSILKIITTKLNLLSAILTIVCTDSFFLYKCLVKLRTTKEKHLMIDIIAIRQSYKQRELFEIR
jgi:hypothetical protein